jgi:two-component system response regulator RstA
MTTTLPLNVLAMVIEDDEKLSVILTEAVNQAGFSARAIRDGAEALKELKALQPTLVVLDLHLPNLSGGSILNAIRSDPKLQSTWVVIVTADPAMAGGLRDQADFVMIKPISFIQLRDLARRLRRLKA